jgi:hypothetical protein
LTSIARKNIFGNNTGGIGLARDNVGNIKARIDIIAGIDITITTWISSRRKHSTRPNKLAELAVK